jgi:hypothetical protein
MNKAAAYKALAQEIERWRSMPHVELIASVGKPASVTYASVNGESIALEIALYWYGDDQAAVRIVGVANGSSHWRLERLEESIVVRLH